MNSMCLDCEHLNKSCPGTASDVWTGCVLKDRPESEAKEYIDHMSESFADAIKKGKGGAK